MDELDPGHDFRLRTLDGAAALYARLTFVKREGARYPGNVGHYPGTTSQEVIRALIARAKYVGRQIPCWETKASVWLFRLVLWLYERRAARVHGRSMPFLRLRRIEAFTTCPGCGHIGCYEHG